jgi:hypothetical protein
MSYFGTTEFDLQSRRGLVSGTLPITLIGHSDTLGTALRIFHQENNTADLDAYALYDTPATVQVASTDNTNDNAAGTGALTVRIFGVNDSGVLTEEDVTMTGQTATTATTALFSSVHKLEVLTSGGTMSNTGVIWCGNGTFTAGVPVTKYMSMELGTSLSAGMVYKVPTAKKLYIEGINLALSDTGTKIINMRFMTYDGSTEKEIFDIHHAAGLTDFDAHQYPAFPAGTLLTVQANVSGSAAIATISMGLYLIDD